MIEITNFEFNPILKGLLIKYVLRTYEEDANTDDDHLYMEYLLLKRENRLNDLFDEEYLINWMNHDNTIRG